MLTTITVPAPISDVQFQSYTRKTLNVNYTLQFQCLKLDLDIWTHSVHKIQWKSQMPFSSVEFCCRLPFVSASSGTWRTRQPVVSVASHHIMQLPVRTAMHIRLLPSGLTKPTQDLNSYPLQKLRNLSIGYTYICKTRAEILSLFCTQAKSRSDHLGYVRRTADTAGRNLPL